MVKVERDVASLRAVAFGDRKLAGSAVQIQGDARLARVFFTLRATLVTHVGSGVQILVPVGSQVQQTASE